MILLKKKYVKLVASITSAVYVWVENFTQIHFFTFLFVVVEPFFIQMFGDVFEHFLFIKKSDFIHVCLEYRIKKILTLVIFILSLALSQILLCYLSYKDLCPFYILLFGKWMGYFLMIMSFFTIILA